MISTPCLLRQPLRRAGGVRLSRGQGGGRCKGDTEQGDLGSLSQPLPCHPRAVVFQHRVVPQSCWSLPEQVGSRGARALLVPPVLC